MTIIILHGKANCGKTTVLKKLYAKIVADNRFAQLCFKKEGNGDLTAVFERNNKKIGLTTLGGTEAVLKDAFNLFIKESCDLCICACRSRDTKNGANNYVKTLSKNLVWYKKACIDLWNAKYSPDIEIDLINGLQATALLKEIEMQI